MFLKPVVSLKPNWCCIFAMIIYIYIYTIIKLFYHFQSLYLLFRKHLDDVDGYSRWRLGIRADGC